MTIRLKQELESLYLANPNPDALTFGVKSVVRNGFKSVCEEAKIKDVTFYTLRHPAATRLVSLHIPLSEVGKVLGHTTPNTTYRYYLNPNVEMIKRAATALDLFNAEEKTNEALELVN